MSSHAKLKHRHNQRTTSTDASHHDPDDDDDANDDEDESSSQKVYLRRQVTLVDSIALTLVIVIGSGIFIFPSGILRDTGSLEWSLVVWIFCGTMSILGALSFAELGTMFPVSGGAYSYMLECYGPLPAFLKLYNELVASSTGGVAVLAIACANYILLPFYPNCQDAYPVTRVIAALILCLTTFVNCYSVPLSRKVNIVFVVCKVLGLMAIFGFGVAEWVKGNTSNLTNAFGGEPHYNTFPLAIYTGLFGYSGWQNIFSMTEEIVQPSRTIPLSIIISLSMATLIFVIVNIAYFSILSFDEIMMSDYLVLDVGRRVMGNWWWTLSILVSLSILGSLNGVALARSRLFYVASREGHIPVIASMIQVRRRTPLPAAVITVPLSLMLLLSDNVYTLINYVGSTGWIFSGLIVAIVPYYRWKHPELKRPFKVPVLIPIIFSLCCFCLVGMSLYSSPLDCGIGLAITLSGVPVYYLTVRWKNKPQWVNRSMDNMTVFLQKVLFVVPREDVDHINE